MTETFVAFGLCALAAGGMLGWARQLWLLAQIATAGSAALAVFALQCRAGLGACTAPTVAGWEGAVFVWTVTLAAVGWFLTRTRDDA